MGERALRLGLSWPGKPGGDPLPRGTLDKKIPRDVPHLVIQGDNLLALSALAKRTVDATLIYLDPPFFTKRRHEQVIREKGASGRITRTLQPAFDDRWEGLENYLRELAARVQVARSLLAQNGCLVLHVDPKTSHYAKVVCDEIFGHECFASEIVWRYRRWPAKTKNFQRVHDVLLRYVADPNAEPSFHQLFEPLAASTRSTWGDRKQRAVVDGAGRRVRSSTTQTKSPGTPLGDVWGHRHYCAQCAGTDRVSNPEAQGSAWPFGGISYPPGRLGDRPLCGQWYYLDGLC